MSANVTSAATFPGFSAEGELGRGDDPGFVLPQKRLTPYNYRRGAGHRWAEPMKLSFIQASALLRPVAVSKSIEHPPTANEYDTFISPSNKDVYFYADETWHRFTPEFGYLIFVMDEEKYYYFSELREWEMALDPNQVHAPIPKTYFVHWPSALLPSRDVGRIASSTEFVIPAGATGSIATLGEPPIGGDLVLTVNGPSGSGTITFLSGQTTGTIIIPSALTIHPSGQEAIYAAADELRVSTPSEVYGARDLSIAFLGNVRSFD